MRDELKQVFAMSDKTRTEWHSRNEVRLATLLLLAEQAEVGKLAYDKIHSIVCLLHKPLTGQVSLASAHIERISNLLLELEFTGFPGWVI